MSFLKRKMATVVFILSYCEFNSTNQREPIGNADHNYQQRQDNTIPKVDELIQKPGLTHRDQTAPDPDSIPFTRLAKIKNVSPEFVPPTRLAHYFPQASEPDKSTDLGQQVVSSVTDRGSLSVEPYPPIHPVYHLPQTRFSEPYIEDNYPLPQYTPLSDPFSYEDERINNIYWQDKLDKLQEMIGDISSNEDNILMLLQEIISHAPEKYRYQAYNSFQSYNPRKKSLLDDELSLVYIPECLMYGSKTEEKKEEVVIHLTSDPKLFDRVFKVVPIRERPKVSEASRIRREKQEAEYREQQRIHAEQYKAKERALKRANGEDMIFDPRVGKKVHFEDYLRSLFLSQLAKV